MSIDTVTPVVDAHPRTEPPARRHISETELVVVPPSVEARRICRAAAQRHRGRRIALLLLIGASLAGGTYAVAHAGSAGVSYGAFEGY